MNRQELILIGAGGHACSCVDVIEAEGKFSIVGFVGTESEVGTTRYGYEVTWADKDLARLRDEFEFAIITIGSIKPSDKRSEKYKNGRALGFQFPTILSPYSNVSRQAVLGPGTIVMHGATINSNVVVGKNCIVNSHSLLEHDVKVGDHSHISTGAILNGGVTVGSGSFLGSGSIVKDRISIGDNCLIGMGVCVRQDIGNSERFVR